VLECGCAPTTCTWMLPTASMQLWRKCLADARAQQTATKPSIRAHGECYRSRHCTPQRLTIWSVDCIAGNTKHTRKQHARQQRYLHLHTIIWSPWSIHLPCRLSRV
jgi:hypothetical protein